MKSPKARVSLPRGRLMAQEPPERLSALMREHNQLLKKIARKRKDFEGLSRRIQETGTALAGARPLIAEAERLDLEIHALFDELLARNRRPRGSRRLVVALYEMLQQIGVLSFRATGVDSQDDWGLDDDHSVGAGSDADGGPTADSAGPSARRPGDAPEDQSLRGIFRRLATALHPDKVQDETEKARRTELMKVILRAYEERDLACLLNLESTWMAGGGPVTAGDQFEGDDVERRCAHIQRMNEALRAQLRTVLRELKDLRRSPQAQSMRNLRRPTAPGEQDPLAMMIAGAEVQLARTRDLRDFVVSFREGRITIEEFLRGPPSVRQQQPDDDYDDACDDDQAAFNAVIDMLFADVSAAPVKRRTKKARRSKRDSRPRNAPL
ncbi:MAG: J domain-containing protein [Myxococcales bacterium]